MEERTISTSYAAAIVSGTAAAVWSINPTLTADQVMDILRTTADRTKSGIPWVRHCPAVLKAMETYWVERPGGDRRPYESVIPTVRAECERLRGLLANQPDLPIDTSNESETLTATRLDTSSEIGRYSTCSEPSATGPQPGDGRPVCETCGFDVQGKLHATISNPVTNIESVVVRVIGTDGKANQFGVSQLIKDTDPSRITDNELRAGSFGVTGILTAQNATRQASAEMVITTLEPGKTANTLERKQSVSALTLPTAK